MSQAIKTYPVQIPREYPPAPLLGVAAAVFNDQGEVLLVQRGRPPSQGLWGLPGGLLDLGESLQDGVCREVREECAVEVEIGGLVTLFEPIHHDADGRVQYHYVVADYWARYVGGTATAADDAADIAWVGLADLHRYPMRAETDTVLRQAHGLWQQSRTS